MGQISLSIISSKQYNQLTRSLSLPLYAKSSWLEGVTHSSGAICYWLAKLGTKDIAVSAIYSPIYNVWITSPNCQYNGIYFLTSIDFSLRRKVIDTFADKFSEVSFAEVSFDVLGNDLLPFYWKGFRLGVRYNYQLDLPKNKEDLYGLIATDAKQKIKKAIKSDATVKYGQLSNDGKILIKRHYLKKNISLHYFDSLLFASMEHGFWAELRDEDYLLGVAFIGLDSNKAYLLAVATDPQLSKDHNYATVFLIFSAMKKSLECGVNIFDFEGSMLPKVERTFRNLGGRPIPYYTLRKGRKTLILRYRLRRYYRRLIK